jgi:hypothetical protein
MARSEVRLKSGHRLCPIEKWVIMKKRCSTNEKSKTI